jgi:hypothetical protein
VMAAETGLVAQLDCDLLVIGSGAGGLSAAVTAAWHGLKVAAARIARYGVDKPISRWPRMSACGTTLP